MKNFSLQGIGNKPELGKDGHIIDGSNINHIEFTDKNGDLIEVRAKDATSASGLVTKAQLVAATGSDAGTAWIEYSVEPELVGFTQRQTKEFNLNTGAADLLTDYSTIPSNMSWNGSDARTYIVDTTNSLITPNALNGQPHHITVEIAYSQKGGVSNTDMGGVLYLVEFDGSSEHRVHERIFMMPDVDNRVGVLTETFLTNVTNKVNGAGKGWRLKIRSNESDGNLTFKLKGIRVQCG